jgi:undecaprenyl-diphosphatase
MAIGTDGIAEIVRPSHVMLRSRTAVLAVSFVALLLGLAAAFAHTWLLRFDQPVSDWFRSAGEADIWLVVSLVGSEWFVIPVLLVLAGLLWERCRPIAIALPSAALVASIVNVSLKVIIDRPRPESSLVDTALPSFPSGHVIESVLFFGLLPPVLWILTGRRTVFRGGVAALIVGVPLVAASRIALGAHWPSDVIGSAFVGAALLLATEYAVVSRAAFGRCEGCRLHVADLRRTSDNCRVGVTSSPARIRERLYRRNRERSSSDK